VRQHVKIVTEVAVYLGHKRSGVLKKGRNAGFSAGKLPPDCAFTQVADMQRAGWGGLKPISVRLPVVLINLPWWTR